MNNYYITYMWREDPATQKDKVYRFQTNDPETNLRMQKRKDFKLSTVGINEKLWIYRTKKSSLEEAKKTLKRLSRCQINFIMAEGIFVANDKVIVSPGEQFSLAF